MNIPASDPEDVPTPSVEQAPPVDVSSLTAMPLATPELFSTEEPIGAESTRPDQSESVSDGWVLIAIIPFEGREPPRQVSDELAEAVWCALSGLWHPALLASAKELPRIESIEAPSKPNAREIRVLAGGLWDQLPSNYRTQADDAQSLLLESGTDRTELIRQIRARMGLDDRADLVESEGMISTANDFLAFGTVRLDAA